MLGGGGGCRVHFSFLRVPSILLYDIIPSPILFDTSGLMRKPDKSEFIRELDFGI